MTKKKQYAIVGSGHRGTEFWGKALTSQGEKFNAELVALVEPNSLRLQQAQTLMGSHVPAFSDLSGLFGAKHVDGLIITSPDWTHDKYILEGLDANVDVISEKPLTIDSVKLQNIITAVNKTEGHLRVSFNYRYAPYATQIRQFLASGDLGEVTSVNFQWFLDTIHGADYFRRWHRRKHSSGSLFVHKASHHFDLLNWWLGMTPQRVFAHGTQRIFGPGKSPFQGVRCLACAFHAECPFSFDIRTNRTLDMLYRWSESVDGYYRDGCVFAPDVDIWDTMTALIRYDHDILVNYTLTAGSPFEGYRVVFNGTQGRLECGISEASVPNPLRNFANRSAARVPIRPHDLGRSVTPEEDDIIRFYPLFGGVKEIRVPRHLEGHGGGDRRMMEDIFGVTAAGPLGHRAGVKSGALSALVGIAARMSAEQRREIVLDDLVPQKILTELPD